MTYAELRDAIQTAPKSWLPALVGIVLDTALRRGVFRDGSLAGVVAKLEDSLKRSPETEKHGE